MRSPENWFICSLDLGSLPSIAGFQLKLSSRIKNVSYCLPLPGTWLLTHGFCFVNLCTHMSTQNSFLRHLRGLRFTK